MKHGSKVKDAGMSETSAQETTPPSEAMQRAQDHYRQTGSFRAVDLARILGDPAQGVSINPTDGGAKVSHAGHYVRGSED